LGRLGLARLGLGPWLGMGLASLGLGLGSVLVLATVLLQPVVGVGRSGVHLPESLAQAGLG